MVPGFLRARSNWPHANSHTPVRGPTDGECGWGLSAAPARLTAGSPAVHAEQPVSPGAAGAWWPSRDRGQGHGQNWDFGS